ncbi:protein CIMAP1D-like [Drosophila bipectinata]|uniref:protein CIMAP1D-like n=1 Tax=Drosophila bipectinata TaxID=42026 RepID=UPI0007E5CCA8|nr:outer dense fiber protein 3-like protein 2 [Drosophila bipectinata]
MGSSKEGKIKSAPAYTMTGREKPPLIPVFIFPGPGYYDGEYTVVKSKPPVYSMRGKFKMLSDDNKPGPGAHCPEKYWEKRSPPAISFGILHSKYCKKTTMVNLSHVPAYSFGIKHSQYLGRLNEKNSEYDYSFSGIC